MRHSHQIIRAVMLSSEGTGVVHKDALTRASSADNTNDYRKITDSTDGVYKMVYFVDGRM